MLRTSRKGRQWGFTLVELTVAIGIVAAAGSNYVGVKKRAKEQVCKSNLRQAGQLIMMYEMANGKLPDAAFFTQKPLEDSRSLIKIIPALKPLLVCPCMPKKLRDHGITFVWNSEWSGKPLSAIRNPTKEWLLVEVSRVSDKAPAPHRGGWHVLYADWSVRRTKNPPELSKEQASDAQ